MRFKNTSNVPRLISCSQSLEKGNNHRSCTIDSTSLDEAQKKMATNPGTVLSWLTPTECSLVPDEASIRSGTGCNARRRQDLRSGASGSAEHKQSRRPAAAAIHPPKSATGHTSAVRNGRASTNTDRRHTGPGGSSVKMQHGGSASSSGSSFSQDRDPHFIPAAAVAAGRGGFHFYPDMQHVRASGFSSLTSSLPGGGGSKRGSVNKRDSAPARGGRRVLGDNGTLDSEGFLDEIEDPSQVGLSLMQQKALPKSPPERDDGPTRIYGADDALLQPEANLGHFDQERYSPPDPQK
ncbi:unnamed protein product, partial [Amoebophrya sp. A25]|eukprot:GSA25T00021620001.1